MKSISKEGGSPGDVDFVAYSDTGHGYTIVGAARELGGVVTDVRGKLPNYSKAILDEADRQGMTPEEIYEALQAADSID